jgi:Acetyltransferase (GNAT) domain
MQPLRWPDIVSPLKTLVPVALKHTNRRIIEFVRTCLMRRLPVVRWRGPARPSGKSATLLVVGEEPWVNYLPARFFADVPQKELISHTTVWRLPALLKKLQSSADLVVMRVDRVSARAFFGTRYLSVPQWIGAWLKVPADPAVLARASKNLREDMRRARHHRLQTVVSYDVADFEAFYKTMYVPYTRSRYGERAWVSGRESMQRSFCRGGLIWVQRDGERLAGVLFMRHQQTFYSLALGTANGELAPLRQGALAATYYAGIEYAHQHGCTEINYGGNRASLHDGVLRYKSKWGATLRDKPDSYFDFLVRWSSFNDAVAKFLSHTSLIFREHGRFSAVHVLDDHGPGTPADALQVHQSLWINGLHRLYVVNTAGWTDSSQPPPHTVLLSTAALPLRAEDHTKHRHAG